VRVYRFRHSRANRVRRYTVAAVVRGAAALAHSSSVSPMAAATSAWPSLAPYDAWAETCDTLHAHTQVLGKLAAALAPPEPQLQHGALRLTARGWETLPLPAPNGTGAFLVALDLHIHHVVVEHSNGTTRRIALMRDRAVGAVTRRVLTAVRELAGEAIRIDPTPQEVHWSVPLDADEQHATYDPHAVAAYFRAATRAALVLAAFRAPYRGRSTPVNAWWGSFDLAVSLFSGDPAVPPSEDFITRNAMDAQEIAVGWWPGDPRHPRPAFYAYAHPATDRFPNAQLAPPQARWEAELGEYLLDHEALMTSADPHGDALAFARSAFQHVCATCDWDPALATIRPAVR
jgi:uncharacterized protein DUF5996